MFVFVLVYYEIVTTKDLSELDCVIYTVSGQVSFIAL